MAGNLRLYGTSGYIEIAAPSTANNTTLILPTDSIQPGLVLLANQTFSNVSTVSLNSCFTSTYNNYHIIVNNIVNSVNAPLRMRYRSSSVDATGSNYIFANNYTAFAGGGGADRGSNIDYLLLVGDLGTVDQRSSAIINVQNPNLTEYTVHSILSNSRDSSAAGAGMHSLKNSYDGFTIYTTSGNFSGNVCVYGYKK